MFEELMEGRIDLAMGPPHLHLGVEGIKAYDARIVLLLPDDHPARLAGQVSVAALRGESVVIAPSGYFSRETVTKAAEREGFSLTVAAESSSPPALVALGKAGVGWPVLPDDYSVVGLQEKPYPVLIDDRGQQLSTPVWLQWRSGSELLPVERAFLRIAAERARAEEREPMSCATRFFAETTETRVQQGNGIDPQEGQITG